MPRRSAPLGRPPVTRRPDAAEALAISFMRRWVEADLERRVLLLAECRAHARVCPSQRAMNEAVISLCEEIVRGLTGVEAAA